MTHSDPVPPRKPRRLGLWIPWGAALILAIGWSGWWLWLRGETEHQIDAAAADLRTHGGQASWATRQIGGYPFRLDVDFTDLKLADASGWAISLPTLKSEAYAFAPTRWIVATRDGATLTEPGAAPLTIASPVMRASLNSWDQHPPRISFVGDDLSLAVPPGAPPFPLASAKSVQFYTKAGPDDQGATLFEIAGGAATTNTDLGRLAGGKPVALTVDAIFSHASALDAPDARTAALGWARAGGMTTLQHLTFAAGATTLDTTKGSFTVGGDGRLAGSAKATLASGGTPAPATLQAHDGALWLGSLKIAPSPRVF